MPITSFTIISRPTVVSPEEPTTQPLNYKGTWDADTNTPTLVGGVGTKGDTFKVSADGETSIDGITGWKIGDYITFNGVVWDKLLGKRVWQGLTGIVTADGIDLFGTEITGIVKSDADNALSAAVAGTDYVSPDATAEFTAGFTTSPYDNGTKSSGTLTPDPANGNTQIVTNGGAFILAAPANDCEIDLWVTNNASAGAITMSGFKTPGTGASGATYGTTNAQRWLCAIRRFNGEASFSWNGPWT